MNIDRLLHSIKEENSRDPEKEVSMIAMNPEWWEQLKEDRQLGAHVQVMATGQNSVQYCFHGIPVEFQADVQHFSLSLSDRRNM